jgi:hypothetical protein
MTFRRDLKRRIRERQERTGERYTTARAHVVGDMQQPPPFSVPIPVVELHDFTEHARAAGLACPVRVTSSLQRSASHIPAVLEQIRRILLGSTQGLDAMQRVALHGEPERLPRTGPAVILATHIHSYLEGLEHGLRGPGPGGRVLAFDAVLDGASRTIIAQLFPQHLSVSLLVLSLFRDDSLWLFDSPEVWDLIRSLVPGGASP